MVRKFTASIGEFEQTENAIQSKQRELLVRRFKIVKPELGEKEILDSLEGDGAVGAVNVFAFAANTEDLERKLEHLRAQRRSMMRLEKSIIALNKLLFDMQNLVLAQGDALNNIENYTQRTLDYQKANTIEQAVLYQKNIRKVGSLVFNRNFLIFRFVAAFFNPFSTNKIGAYDWVNVRCGPIKIASEVYSDWFPLKLTTVIQKAKCILNFAFVVKTFDFCLQRNESNERISKGSRVGPTGA